MGCSLHPAAPRQGRHSCAECRRAYNREYHRRRATEKRARDAARMVVVVSPDVPEWGLCFCGKALPPPTAGAEDKPGGGRVWFCSAACKRACVAFTSGRAAAGLEAARR